MKFKESEKCITVDSLNITRNIMMWDETMIQLSNVSAITTRPLNPIYVPWYPAAAVLLLLGLSGIQSYSGKTMGFFMIIAGAVMAFWCFNMNSERKEQTILTVQMNSGVSYFFKVQRQLRNLDPSSAEYRSLKQIVEMKNTAPQSIMNALKKHLADFSQGVLSNVVAVYISKRFP